jgi:hypothetical protein
LSRCHLWNGTNKPRQHGPHISEKRRVKRNVDSERIPRRDLNTVRYSLYNLHAFLKRSGALIDFAHSLGPSVKSIGLDDTTVLGSPAKIYHRTILMKDLFEGAPQVIDFIGGSPDLLVVDSHCYFRHRHNHYYSGMIHSPGEDEDYEALRRELFACIQLV